jgi:hypothetical protein
MIDDQPGHMLFLVEEIDRLEFLEEDDYFSLEHGVLL